MVKTQSQAGNITIKKEEEDGKADSLLKGISNKRSSNRIVKRTPPTTNNGCLPP
jgi:hypothetical protein